MGLSLTLALAALIGSIVLLLQNAHHRALAMIALAVSGAELILASGIIHFSIRGLSLGLLFGVALAVVGGLMFMRTHRKPAVAAATVVAFVGIVQLLAAVR
jgi:hypothetical protein